MHRVQLRGRPTSQFVYSGRSVLVTDATGVVDGRDPTGLYVDNTRVLSLLRVLVDGTPPRRFSASPVGADGFLAYDELPESGGIPGQSVYLETVHFVGEGMRTFFRLRSHASTPARFELAVDLAADFADTDEAETGDHRQSAPAIASWDERASELSFRSPNERLDRAVAIRLDSAGSPIRHDSGRLAVTLEVAARGSAEMVMTVEPVFDGQRMRCTGRRSFLRPVAPLEHLRSDLAAEMPTLTSSNATVTKAWETAVRDLASLPHGLAEGAAAPIAGLPLYLQFFGRDTLTIGWQSLMATPTLLRDSLLANAAWRGTGIDDWLDEEPGKMIHQARRGPLSVLGDDPFTRYYGDWATPPDFLIMLGQYLAWTGDRETIRTLLPAARDALDWCERFGDFDRDGFLEYDTRSSKGVKNQGWKDSDDAVVDENGDIVPNPIASSELQAYWYAGLRQAALAFAACGDLGFAADLVARSERLRKRFNERFWIEDLGVYAFGLDPRKEHIRSVSSNDGHLLAAGIVPPRRGRRLATRLMQPDMFSGWGIRTLSADHPAFNPFSYHRGSVWPVEQGTIAFGFARYGCWEHLHRLAEGVFASTDLFVENRLPEAVGGIQRDAEHPHPGTYPDSCEPQGWSASAIVMLVQSVLAMVAVAPLRLVACDPHLPEWLPDLRLDGLRVGRSRLDIEFRRTRRGTTYRVLHRDGGVRVIRQPPPEAPGSGPVRRARVGLASILRS